MTAKEERELAEIRLARNFCANNKHVPPDAHVQR